MKITSVHIVKERGLWFYIRKDGDKVRCTPRACEFCGKRYVAYPSPYQKHCSRRCGQQCRRTRPDHHPEERPMKGETAPRWKGGRRLDPRGYALIWQPDHPSLEGTTRKYVAEHRLVMERKLGRFLESWETVHHKNGIRDDNRLSNLELWDRSQPAGQRNQERCQPHCSTCTCFTAVA